MNLELAKVVANMRKLEYLNSISECRNRHWTKGDWIIFGRLMRMFNWYKFSSGSFNGTITKNSVLLAIYIIIQNSYWSSSSYPIVLQVRTYSMVESVPGFKKSNFYSSYSSNFTPKRHDENDKKSAKREWWLVLFSAVNIYQRQLYWINSARRRRTKSKWTHSPLDWVPLKSQPPDRTPPLFKKIRVLKSRNNVNLLVIFIYLSWSVLHCGVNIYKVHDFVFSSFAVRTFIHPPSKI